MSDIGEGDAVEIVGTMGHWGIVREVTYKGAVYQVMTCGKLVEFHGSDLRLLAKARGE